MSAHDQDGFLPRPPQEMTFLTHGTEENNRRRARMRDGAERIAGALIMRGGPVSMPWVWVEPAGLPAFRQLARVMGRDGADYTYAWDACIPTQRADLAGVIRLEVAARHGVSVAQCALYADLPGDGDQAVLHALAELVQRPHLALWTQRPHGPDALLQPDVLLMLFDTPESLNAPRSMTDAYRRLGVL